MRHVVACLLFCSVGLGLQAAAAETSPTGMPTTLPAPAPIPATPLTSLAPREPPTLPKNFVTIRPGDELQITPQEQHEWYHQGPWPLIGSVGAVIISNCVAIVMVYLSSSRSFNAILKQRKIDFLSLCLNDFYNPLLALIEINQEIFSKIGPSSFPEEHLKREAAALVWKEMKKKIIENNREIELLLRSKTHLIHKSDSLDGYNALFLHVAMYETFQEIETDQYACFLFPNDVKSHIIDKRRSVLDQFHPLFGELP